MIRNIFYLLICIAASFSFAAENGTITGKIVDGQTGEPLPGVNVVLKGTMRGAATSLDGAYRINSVTPGTYNIVATYIGYSKKTIQNIEVKAGKVVKLDFTMTMEALQGEEVVITAKALENTEATLLKNRQKSNAVSDAISAEAISRTGSSDAAEAMSKVTGASVVDGKYVYVRGLGERYSSTHLNGAELPTADPDKKAFQLDLFPANLLDNIVTVKSFTPDKPGNFSGGIVDIGTKDFPEEFTFSVSASGTYNTQSTFNENFMLYPGGKKDWLGLDDGTRNVPDLWTENIELPSPTRARIDAYRGDINGAERVNTYSKAFNSVMGPIERRGPVNQSYSVSLGNQVNVFNKQLGYIAGLTYSRNASFYDNGERNLYKLSDDLGTTLNPQLLLQDKQGKIESNWGAMLNLGYKFTPNHKLSLNSMYSQSGESKGRYQIGSWPKEYGIDDKNTFFENRVLSYTERTLSSFQLKGQHLFNGLWGSTLNWSASLADNQQDEPDLRFFANTMTINDLDTTYSSSHSGFRNPARYFRDMEEKNQNYSVDFEIPFKQWNGLQSNFKVGAAYQDIDRQFRERYFSLIRYANKTPADNVKYKGNPEEFFSDENMGVVKIDTTSSGKLKYSFGNVVNEGTKPENNYDGDQSVSALYGMFRIPILPLLNFIGGVRYETTDIIATSQDTTLNPGEVETGDLLPSLNFVYMLSNNMNLRAAYTRTLARPTFREIAPYSSFEFIQGNFFIGNPTLKRTLIDNYDLRWEWFMRPGEIVAISAFYKDLSNPIERTIIGGTNGQIQYKNVDKALVYGLEFEARKQLDIIHPGLKNFSFGGNFSWSFSEIDITASEFEIRKVVNPGASRTRELQGQSPYLLNLDLSYSNPNNRTNISVHFNTFGKRISNISMGGTPDVYERPRPNLNLTASKQIMDNIRIKARVKNILDSDYKESYEYKGNEFIYYRYHLGRSFSVGLGYDL